MAEIQDLTIVDASNTARFPENQAPSTINNGARALEGLVARWHRDTNGSKASTGSANAYVFAADQTLSAYYDGLTISFDANFTNTGAATLNVDAVSADAIVWPDGAALISGDITSGGKTTVVHDGTSWQLQTPTRALSSGASAPLLDEDDMSSDSATSVATQQSIKAYVDALPFPKSHIAGLILSRGTATRIDVSAGECRGSDDDENIVLAAFTKLTSATWTSGTGNGGLSSSLTAVANDTWYHVHAIMVSGSADVGIDTSVTAANLVADHSATAYRRIGSFLTNGSAEIIAFLQIGDEFYWDVPVQDYSTGGSTSPTLHTLSTPLGLKVRPLHNHIMESTTTTLIHSLVTDPDQTATGPSATVRTVSTRGTGEYNSVPILVYTDTSGQIRSEQSSTTGLNIKGMTFGWIDPRGRDA
jgi:hypothetical protein